MCHFTTEARGYRGNHRGVSLAYIYWIMVHHNLFVTQDSTSALGLTPEVLHRPLEISTHVGRGDILIMS